MSKASDDGGGAAELRPEYLSDGHLQIGPFPRFPEVPRWATVANVPARELPLIPRYTCRKVTRPLTIDGRLDEPEGTGPSGPRRLGGSRPAMSTRRGLAGRDAI